MCRSVFFATLAALLAGAHTAGPVGFAGMPRAARESTPSPRPACAPDALAPCR